MPMRSLNRRKTEEDDEEEQASLVTNGRSRRVAAGNISNQERIFNAFQYGYSALFNAFQYGHALLRSKPLVVAAVALFMVVAVSLRTSTHLKTPPSDDAAWNAPTNGTEPLFSCPASFESLPVDNEDFDKYYANTSKNITQNKTEFLETFRTTKFDAWQADYNTVKRWSTPFKAKYYPKYLKPGSKLYESACGIGLNLYMTLEILQEHNISGITVYGNDYVAASEKVSRLVLSEGVIPEGNHRGVICAADSTNLSHVPSNTFDVVYTGYVTPLWDSLNILTEEEVEKGDDKKWDQICAQVKSDKPEDWMGKALWKEAVAKQQDWYGRWVAEMARIAKPGAPVIVEEVSYPYCEYDGDWDGVEKDFWNRSATSNKYHWDIDPASIEIMKLKEGFKRYNVFMLKKK